MMHLAIYEYGFMTHLLLCTAIAVLKQDPPTVFAAIAIIPPITDLIHAPATAALTYDPLNIVHSNCCTNP
jgi:hypothetical protein